MSNNLGGYVQKEKSEELCKICKGRGYTWDDMGKFEDCDSCPTETTENSKDISCEELEEKSCQKITNDNILCCLKQNLERQP